jgi:hypothetical protein
VPRAAFASANDVAYGVTGVARNGPVVSPAAGFAEIAEVSSGETSALQAEWATNQPTVGASWTTSTKAGMLGVEIKAGNAGPVVPVASVEVSPATANVSVGSTAQLTATLMDAAGEPLNGRTITWSSDAPQFATVSSTGLVTGVAIGAATITATSEGISGSASVTVTSTRCGGVGQVTPASSVSHWGTVQLIATAKDAQETSSPAVVPGGRRLRRGGGVVDVSRRCQGRTATITATSENITGSASVAVTAGGAATLGQWSACRVPIIRCSAPVARRQVLMFGDQRDS